MFPDAAIVGFFFILLAVIVVVPLGLYYLSRSYYHRQGKRSIEGYRTDVLDSPNLDQVRDRQFRGLDKRVG